MAILIEMPAENFPKIKANYAAYQKFLHQEKILEKDTLELNEEAKKRRCGGSLKIAASLNGKCDLHAKISVIDRGNYSTRIFAEAFGENPCFRFCSKGRPHMNRDAGGELKNRRIPTPHFHRVDTNGIMCATQQISNAHLADQQVSDSIFNHPEFGINLFCQESNVVSPNKGSVVVKINTSELPLSTDDPLAQTEFTP